MNPNEIEVRVDRTGGRLTILLRGELDCATAGDLDAAVADHVGPADHHVVLDLTDVTFCASAGLTSFIRLHNEVRDRGGRFELHGPTGPVLRAIQLCRLDEVLTVTPALAAPA